MKDSYSTNRINVKKKIARLGLNCRILVIQANWFRHPEFGLVGSMDDKDLERLLLLAPHAQYKRITSGHMIHFEKPEEYRQVVSAFAKQIMKK